VCCVLTSKPFNRIFLHYLLSHTMGRGQDVCAVNQRTATELSPTVEQGCLDLYTKQSCIKWGESKINYYSTNHDTKICRSTLLLCVFFIMKPFSFNSYVIQLAHCMVWKQNMTTESGLCFSVFHAKGLNFVRKQHSVTEFNCLNHPDKNRLVHVTVSVMLAINCNTNTRQNLWYV
jgi:hypothetical protein